MGRYEKRPTPPSPPHVKRGRVKNSPRFVPFHQSSLCFFLAALPAVARRPLSSFSICQTAEIREWGSGFTSAPISSPLKGNPSPLSLRYYLAGSSSKEEVNSHAKSCDRPRFTLRRKKMHFFPAKLSAAKRRAEGRRLAREAKLCCQAIRLSSPRSTLSLLPDGVSIPPPPAARPLPKVATLLEEAPPFTLPARAPPSFFVAACQAHFFLASASAARREEKDCREEFANLL